jgi:ATP-dependent DNA helicase RecQ
MMSEDHQYNEAETMAIVSVLNLGAIDEVLMGMLRDLKSIQKNRTTAICFFQDPSLEDMALKYPISLNDHIHGGRRERRNMPEFVELINQYVIDNEIYVQTICC